MNSHSKEPTRRDFLKQGALGGLAALIGDSLLKVSFAATKERITLLSSVGLDTLHPYAYTSGPQYGIWLHMIEPLVEVDYAKKQYICPSHHVIGWTATLRTIVNSQIAVLICTPQR